jgi:hypothetical protein
LRLYPEIHTHRTSGIEAGFAPSFAAARFNGTLLAGSAIKPEQFSAPGTALLLRRPDAGPDHFPTRDL